jgi:hypothetical protein
MDDGRPLESKGTSHPGLYPAASAAAAPELKKKEEKCREEWAKGLSEKFTNTKLPIEFQVTRDVMRDDKWGSRKGYY